MLSIDAGMREGGGGGGREGVGDGGAGEGCACNRGGLQVV